MNEQDIRNFVAALERSWVAGDMPTAWGNGFALLAQALVDLNRIAAAMERTNVRI